MQSEELKPCPFCGGNNLRFHLSDIEGWIAHVECTDCDDMLGPMSEYKHDDKEDAEKDAAEVWNRRPAIEAALSASEPVAAMTTDYLGCEYVSMDVAGIEKIAAAHSKGPTEVVYLYAAPPAPSVAVKALEWKDIEAYSATGHYRVQRLDDKWEPLHNGYYMLPKMYGVVKAFDTQDEAKAHCQKHHDNAILSALSAQVQDESEIVECLLAGKAFVFDPATNFCHAVDGGAPEHGIKYVPAAQVQDVAGWQLVPVEPTSEMEDAARHLMMWLDFARPTEAALIAHCKRLGKTPPPECRDVDHVPSKAMRLFWVYRAMLAAAPAKKEGGHD